MGRGTRDIDPKVVLTIHGRFKSSRRGSAARPIFGTILSVCGGAMVLSVLVVVYTMIPGSQRGGICTAEAAGARFRSPREPCLKAHANHFETGSSPFGLDEPEAWSQCPWPATGAGFGDLPNGLDLASQVPARRGSSRAPPEVHGASVKANRIFFGLPFPAAASMAIVEDHPVGFHAHPRGCHRFTVPCPLLAEPAPRNQQPGPRPAPPATDAAHSLLRFCRNHQSILPVDGCYWLRCLLSTTPQTPSALRRRSG